MKILGLIVSMVICFAAAAAGSAFTNPSLPQWYAALHKPAWNPPNWLFAPVWTALFAMMAVAVWLVWSRAGFLGSPLATGLFAVQLALNIAWSAVFFGMRNPDAAFAEIVTLWVSIAVTVVAFAQVDAVAAWLLAPYLAWVSFASVLNWTIWRLNAG